jgi:hypothetical protein
MDTDKQALADYQTLPSITHDMEKHIGTIWKTPDKNT